MGSWWRRIEAAAGEALGGAGRAALRAVGLPPVSRTVALGAAVSLLVAGGALTLVGRDADQGSGGGASPSDAATGPPGTSGAPVERAADTADVPAGGAVVPRSGDAPPFLTAAARDGGHPATQEPSEPGHRVLRTIVLSGEGNRLNAYDAMSGTKQTLIASAADDPEHGLDINAQICIERGPDGVVRFIAGEDTDQDGEGVAGWGWFELEGEEVGAMAARQVGKLVPTYSNESSNPENYGCGFLPDGRLVTSDVGDIFPWEPGNGQLIVWFPPLDDGTSPSVDAHYCKLDASLGTAGGVWVDDDFVYVATNRPSRPRPGGVYRYPIAQIPNDASCAGHGRDEPLVDAGAVERELWIPADAHAVTPSAVVPSGRSLHGRPTWYVSSVFTGTIAEYADLGAARVWVRNVVEPPAGLPVGQAWPSGTPFGMAVASDGTLFYADLGIQGPGPADGAGSLQAVRFDANGNPEAPVVVDEGLDFPDGVAVLEALVSAEPSEAGAASSAAPSDPVRDPGASSSWGCGHWGMYGASPARAFAYPDGCTSPLRATTVPTLVPKWTVKTAKTVTASPAVVGDRLYVGDWSGTMYAVDTDDGNVAWTFETPPASGAAFGPIVSSAAVARIDLGGGSRREVVVFGAGPRVFALEASSGRELWRSTLDHRADTPVEVESSPVVTAGLVYVGFDNHDTPDTGVRGGVVALDATDGSERWRFEPELGEADAGCGGVWSSPTVDASRGLLFVATANCPRRAAWTPHTEAVTALDAATGAPRWSFRPHLPNRKDWDFGATPNLFRDATGRWVLGAASKDGTYYALDPATGSLFWRAKAAEPGDVGEDSSIGGFIGSPAAHRGRVFGTTALGGPPYYHALDGTTGEVRWRGAAGPSYAASAAVNDVAFAGALDGVLRAFHAESGVVLWQAPLLGPISSGPAVRSAEIFIGSGTSSSDACAKELPVNRECLTVFDEGLGSTGGIHAFRLPG